MQSSLESSPTDEFDPTQQTWRLLKEQPPHLIFTIVLLTLFIVTLVLFKNAGNVSHDTKIWFNVITTILNLALGLNFLEAFKDMAKVLRWRVLANRSFTVREVDLILGGESLMKLGKLMWESRTKPVTIIVCASWIALNLLAQASIAMLSMTYSMDGGTNTTGIYTGDGIVNAAKLDCYYEREGCPVAPGMQLTTAHNYGELIQGQRCCRYQDDSDIHNGSQTCPYFCHDNGQEFAHRYVEYNPHDEAQAYPYLTNRTVRASTGQCYQYDVDWPNSLLVSGTDGKDDVQVFAFTNGTFTGHLPIPRSQGEYNSTTYVYNGSALPRDDTETACGPRCLWIYVLRLGIPKNNSLLPAVIFSCPITVSEVHNATWKWQFLLDSEARLAAASIALTGRYTSPEGRGIVWQQYQLYPWGSFRETHNLDAQQVGADIAEFAVGSLVAMANLNPKQQVPGTLPTLGYHLDAHWQYIIALAACIGGFHCILVALMLRIAGPTIVIDDSNLCTARILQGLVGRLNGRGSLLSAEELAEGIQRAGSQKGQAVYGIERELSGRRVLTLGEDVPVRTKLINGRFTTEDYA
ncbi:MAG: hypothetical protein LQ347_004963 [Umbilicaria vellea]|nr:MAG: hypothetical protein LQ347_004963 [Umbilicaria vellea]